jgi:hypothetical protein
MPSRRSTFGPDHTQRLWPSSIDGVTNSMDRTEQKSICWGRLAALLALPATLMLTGCQVQVAGQTLPSPYYLTDDVQYFAPGPGFKLAREAAAAQEQKAAEQSQPQGVR